MAHVIEKYIEIDDLDEKDQHLSQSTAQVKQMSQQMVSPDMEVIPFDNYQVILPKGDLKKEWNKLKKYMDIKLENYEYKEPVEEEKLEPTTEEQQEEEYHIIPNEIVSNRIKKNHQDYLNAKASRDKTATLRKFVLLESDKDNYLNKWENLKLT